MLEDRLEGLGAITFSKWGRSAGIRFISSSSMSMRAGTFLSSQSVSRPSPLASAQASTSAIVAGATVAGPAPGTGALAGTGCTAEGLGV